MSFLGGPECSTAANPLAQFQKQTGADTSLQRDRLTSRQPQHLNGFRSQQGIPDNTAFQDFAQQGPQLPHGALGAPPLMEAARREMGNMSGGGGGAGWAAEFAGQPGPRFSPEEFAAQQGRTGALSPQDFAAFQQAQHRQQSPSFQGQSAFARPAMYRGAMASGFGMQRPTMYQPTTWAQDGGQQYEGKGKSRIQELSDTDWEQQFAELSTADKEDDQEALDKEAQDAIERELNGLDRQMAEGLDQFKDFDGLEGSDMLGQFDNFDFTDLRTHETNEFNQGPELGNYLFEQNNPFREIPNAFEEGQKIMREGGSLSLAALAFEAAIQQREDFVDAWVALGQAQAQNEKESPAIRALEKAISIDPNNLDALMGLSVSYTNEGYDSLAYRTLERWISIKYPQLGVQPRGLHDPDADMGFTDRQILHEKVTALFLEAAQLNPEGGNVDVDVQVGLGVLFYGSEDYDKAVDCFTAALNSAQHGSMKREGEEHLLWNRLGATLANSGRSEEAIDAYSRALEIRANFVRARYNLGVSCINLGVLEEAASHLLGALSMHRVLESEGRQKAAELLKDGHGNSIIDESTVDNLLHQNQSTNLYDTLRRVFTQMGRRDLSEMVGPDMNLDALRGSFDF